MPPVGEAHDEEDATMSVELSCRCCRWTRRRARPSRGTAARARSPWPRAARAPRTPCAPGTASSAGRASRGRRLVFDHDQSSTAAPRCCVRLPPGWCTRTTPPPSRARGAPRPRRRTAARAGRARRSRGRRGSCPSSSLVRAARDDAAVVEHDDLVRERDRREPVGDDQRRAAPHRLAQAEPDPRLGRRVDRGGRVVEDQDARVDDECARDRDPLALPARERDPALADHGVVALRQLLDELVRLREPRDALDLLVVESGAPKAMFSRTVAEKRNGSCEMTPTAWRSECSSTSRTSTPSTVTRPAGHVVEARHERGQRRLARAGVPDQRDRRPGGDVEVDVVEHRRARSGTRT